MKALIVSSVVALACASGALAQGGFGAPVQDSDRAAMLSIGAQERRAAAADYEERALKASEAAELNEARIGEITREVARFEAAIEDSRERLVTLVRNEADASADLYDRRRRHAATFLAIVALSKAQAPAIVAHDGDATVAARSATALKGLRAALTHEARDTQRRTTEIRDLRKRTEIARVEAKAAILSLRAREKELWTLVGKRRSESEENRARARVLRGEAQQLTAKAEALDVVIARAPAPARKPVRVASLSPVPVRLTPIAPPVSDARGRLMPPVAGDIAARYDAKDGGIAAHGLVFEAKPYALVQAPWDGTISYAGPVKSLGLVTVIDIGEGHQVVMAGLASNEREKGDTVSRGDPIGHLGGPISDGDAFLIEESAPSEDAVTSLYFQMRRNGDPIDPSPWLE